MAEGKDLDGGNNCYPYCIIQVEGYQTKTPVLEKTNKPEWYEEYNFEIFEDDSIISISVWNENHYSDKRIGQLYLSLEDLKFENQTILPENKSSFNINSQWFKLDAPSKYNISGDVCLKLVLSNDKINIIILEARNLPASDNGAKSDPYFKV